MSEEITGQLVGATFEDGTVPDCWLDDCECPDHGRTPTEPGTYITIKLDDENASIYSGPVKLTLLPLFKEPEVYPALTSLEFYSRSLYGYGELDFVETEDGDRLIAFGHAPVAEVTEAVKQIAGEECAPTIQHLFAVTTSPAPEWYISWDGKYASHPNRFPVTVVTL